MKKNFLRAVSLSIAGALAAAAPLSAQAFHKYVALGDSLTAGLEGGCLVARHQNRSFPKILADQIGIADFQQPTVSELPLSALTSGTPCLGAVLSGTSISAGPVSWMGPPTNATLARPYDNLGIPGAAVSDLVDLKTANPSGDTANKFSALILRNFPTGPFEGKSAVDEANLLAPDFVTLWIGSNDVLGAALAGVAVDGVTLTPEAFFNAKYTETMDALSASGRTIVVLNVVDVTALPFVTTIPPVILDPVTRQPVIIGGQTVPLLGDRLVTGCAAAPCPLPADTLVTLQAAPLLARGIGIPAALGGTGLGLPDGSVDSTGFHAGVLLYADEVQAIQARTLEINADIASAASAHGAVLLDIHSIFNDVKANGYSLAGIHLTTSFLQGGIFSADGFHPSNIAYAIVADEIIKALNAAKGTSIEEPNLAQSFFAADVPVSSATAVSGGPFGFTAEDAAAILALVPGFEPTVPRTAPILSSGSRRGRAVRPHD